MVASVSGEWRRLWFGTGMGELVRAWVDVRSTTQMSGETGASDYISSAKASVPRRFERAPQSDQPHWHL